MCELTRLESNSRWYDAIVYGVQAYWHDETIRDEIHVDILNVEGGVDELVRIVGQVTASDDSAIATLMRLIV